MKYKKRKHSEDSPIRDEIKEENAAGNYLAAKGRLNSVLKQLSEQTDSESESSDDNHKKATPKKRKENQQAYHHTYVMKLFDRSVDLAKFEEDTPLYPICRAWMQNQPRNPQSVIKRRLSSPEPRWNDSMSDVHRLPPPLSSFQTRIPSPLPCQAQNKEEINLNYDETTLPSKEELLDSHLERWHNVKRHWIKTAAINENRYAMSTQILKAIYNRFQDGLE